MDQFNLAGRYPDADTPIPSLRVAGSLMVQVEEVLQCLRDQL